MTIIIQLALLAVSALLTFIFTKKPKDPEVPTASFPAVEDGKGIERLYGTCWFDDCFVLGRKDMGTKKIRAKGGKKG